jgi:hypothetical protein
LEIKGKTSKQSRKTLAGQIKNQANVADAYLLAIQGRKFSEIEDLLDFFYTTHDELERRKIEKETHSQKFWRQVPKQAINAISNTFKEKSKRSSNLFRSATGSSKDLKNENNKTVLDILGIVLFAIKTKDSATIFEIGKAIEFFKTPVKSADPYRKKILFAKFILDSANLKMTIGALASALKLPKQSSLDGFSQLRRICRDLKFPLKASRKIGDFAGLQSLNSFSRKDIKSHRWQQCRCV